MASGSGSDWMIKGKDDVESDEDEGDLEILNCFPFKILYCTINANHSQLNILECLLFKS